VLVLVQDIHAHSHLINRSSSTLHPALCCPDFYKCPKQWRLSWARPK
jgi:hypothetical protein